MSAQDVIFFSQADVNERFPLGSALLAVDADTRPKVGVEAVEHCSNTVLPKCRTTQSVL